MKIIKVKKITATELRSIRKRYEREKVRIDIEIRKPYDKALSQFLDDHCPVIVNKVYKLVENGVKRRGLSRLVITGRKILWFDGTPTIIVGLHWLDGDNMPRRSDTFTVYGVGNPAKFELSDNQTFHKHKVHQPT